MFPPRSVPACVPSEPDGPGLSRSAAQARKRAAGRALLARGKLATAVLGLGSGLESAAAIAESLTRRAA